jgi:hypothetical protein
VEGTGKGKIATWNNGAVSIVLKVPMVGSAWNVNCHCFPKNPLLFWWMCGIVSMSTHYHIKKKSKGKKREIPIPAIVSSFCCFPLATGAYSFSETQKLVSQATAALCSVRVIHSFREMLRKVVRDCYSTVFVPIICSCLLGWMKHHGIVYHRLYIR